MQFNAKIENLFLIPSDNNRVSYMVLHARNLKSNSSYWQNISIIYWYAFNKTQIEKSLVFSELLIFTSENNKR